MSVKDEAREYIHGVRPEWHDNGVGIVQGSHYRAGFIAGAEWQASRTPEAALSDTDLADLILALRGNPANARGRWPNVKECAAAADALERLRAHAASIEQTEAAK